MTAYVEAIADSVVRALQGTNDTFALANVLPSSDDVTGLAAVRALGADVLLPFTFGGHRFSTTDAEVIASSFAAFPAPELDIADDARSLAVHALRNRATGQALAELGRNDLSPTPMSSSLPAETAKSEWKVWAATLARLSPLATPGLNSKLHVQAGERQWDTARGLTRAVLRRDYLTAARIARWLAAGSMHATPPLDVKPVLRHLSLHADDASTRLEIHVARACLGDHA